MRANEVISIFHRPSWPNSLQTPSLSKTGICSVRQGQGTATSYLHLYMSPHQPEAEFLRPSTCPSCNYHNGRKSICGSQFLRRR